VDLPGMRKAGVNALWMALCGTPTPDPANIRTAEYPLEGLEFADTIFTDILDRYPDDFELARTAEDVHRIRGRNKIAILLGMQAGHMLGDSVRALRMFHRIGVQYVTLTHHWTSNLADSSSDKPKWGGLSELGRQMVREMNRLGVLPDVSHTTDRAAEQTLEVSQGPVIASHSNSRTLCPCLGERNLSDGLIRRIAKSGGVVNVNFSPALISPSYGSVYETFPKTTAPALNRFMQEVRKKYPNDLEKQYDERMKFLAERGIQWPTHREVVDHIEYIARLAGWDHVGIGSDYDGTGLLERNLEDVSQFPYLTYELLRRGVKESDIRKVLGENMLRALTQAQETARRLQGKR